MRTLLGEVGEGKRGWCWEQGVRLPLGEGVGITDRTVDEGVRRNLEEESETPWEEREHTLGVGVVVVV